VGHGPESASIGDLDGDGKPDLVVVDVYANRLTIFRNTSTPGNISFASVSDLIRGNIRNTSAIVDLDGDGKEIWQWPTPVSSIPSYSIFQYLRIPLSDQIFHLTTKWISRQEWPKRNYRRDLDSDGKPDLAVVNHKQGNISVFRNNSTPGIISLAPKLIMVLMYLRQYRYWGFGWRW